MGLGGRPVIRGGSFSAAFIQRQVVQTLAGLQRSEFGLQVTHLCDEGFHSDVGGQVGVGGHDMRRRMSYEDEKVK